MRLCGCVRQQRIYPTFLAYFTASKLQFIKTLAQDKKKRAVAVQFLAYYVYMYVWHIMFICMIDYEWLSSKY